MDEQAQNAQCEQSKAGNESETPNSTPIAPPNSERPKYNSRTNALDVVNDVDLKGKTALITGTNSGIGTETARTLCLGGAHVVMANRNIVESEKLRDEIMKEKPDAEIDLLNLDLSSLQSVEVAAKNYLSKNWPLHILILNAGIFGPQEKITIDGYERHFGVNHLGHFYLTYLLLPRLRQSAPSRIVIVSSKSHSHTGIDPSSPTDEKLQNLTASTPTYLTKNFYRLYANSKLCNVLMAMKLHRMEHQNGINVYVLHPGTMIATGISRGFGFLARVGNALVKPFTKTLQQGAATSVYCAVSEDLNSESGKYYESCCVSEDKLSGALAHDEALQDALWDKSMEFVEKHEKNRAKN